jgi:glutaconate CoA-transferase subunit B
VFDFDESGEMVLVSLHSGITKDEVQANTGWPLRFATTMVETPAPTAAELALIRQFDTLGS